MRKITMLFLVLLFTYSIKIKAQTLQSVTSNGGNTTTNDIFVNRILGYESNRSSIIIGTGNSYLSGNLNGQSYIIGYHNTVSTSSYQSVFGISNVVSGTGNIVIGRLNNAPASNHGVVFGMNNIARGYKSMLLGYDNTALANTSQSFAVGRKNEVSNSYASAFGYNNIASAYEAAAFGVKNQAINYLASAFGYNNIANGARSIAYGYQNSSSGLYSISFGKENSVTSSRGVAVGCNNSVTADYACAFGRDLTNNVSSSVKIGVSNSAYMMILNSGNVGIGVQDPQAKLHIVDGGLTIRTSSNIDNSFQLYPQTARTVFSIFRNGSTTNQAFTIGTDNNDNTVIGTNNADLKLNTNNVIVSGNIGIGTQDTKGYKLAVAGKIVAEKVVVKMQSNWPDYVFHPNYKLRPLNDVERYIKTNNHLPDVPSAEDISKNGADLGDNQTILLKKIEELTLYLIEQNKKIALLEQQVKQLTSNQK